MDQRFLLLVFLIPIVVLGQNEMPELGKENSSSAYIKVGVGLGNSSFRDKATSPLFYHGSPLAGTFGLENMDNRKEVSTYLSVLFGNYTAELNERGVGSATFSSLTIGHSRLYGIPAWSGQHWSYKVGGTALLTGNIRLNPSLQNNALGYEGFLNVMGSFKISRDVSRNREKNLKLWFVHITLAPRQRTLSSQFNLGLWNNALRNGYPYIDQYGVVNDWRAFGGYEFKTFSGLRFSTEINYTLFLVGARNNAVQLSYAWDALQTEGGQDAFAMAFHTLKISLLYNTK